MTLHSCFRRCSPLLLTAGLLSAQTLYVPGGSLGTSSTGGVGIGTASPQADLHVVGGLRSDGSSYPGFYTFDGSTPLAAFQVDVAGSILNIGDLYSSAPSLSLRLFTADVERLRIDTSGNVGIGTTSPGRLLDVADRIRLRAGPSGTAGLWLHNATVDAGFVGLNDNGLVGLWGNSGAGWGLLMDTSSGNIGIGTATPGARLEVAGGSGSSGVQSFFSVQAGFSAPSAGNAAFSSGTKLVLWNDVTTPQKLSIGMDGNADMWFNNSGGQAGAGFTFYTANGGSATPNARLKIAKDGNIGIGTTAPTHKLAVNGTIRAMEVIVDIGWADYVFADDYELAPLHEVEAHIREKKHLPGIPSAQEVAEQGVSVGEMQSLLLAKIEELTLYQIQMKRELEDVKAENNDLRREVAQLKDSP